MKPKNTPIPYEIVTQKLQESNISALGKASIREIKRLIDVIEEASNSKYIRMEMGIPGLPASQIAVNAEKEALQEGVASIYPDIQGIKPLKKQISLFVKNFMGISVSEQSCLPTVGSMMGSFASFILLDECFPEKDTVLFIDPGFPQHKAQLRTLGKKHETFDVYDFRGEKLHDKLESYLKKGNIHSILYSNPNNPSWICFTEEELRIIGSLSKKYDVIVLEDLAYFGMDFRTDVSEPGKPPYQPSVANYCDNYILYISSSKAFSYAGQRCGMMVISDNLFDRDFAGLQTKFKTTKFGYAMVFGAVYSISAGTCHTAQRGLAAVLEAVNKGSYNFVHETKEYAEKAKIMKKLFTENGFYIVYDKDIDKPLADGFYFTIAYPGMTGNELIQNLLYYGISAITLEITGSERTEGLRACVSLVQREQFPDLEVRLKQFHQDFPI